VGQVQEVLRPPAESELAGELELAAESEPPAESGESAFAEASESEPAEFERETREPII